MNLIQYRYQVLNLSPEPSLAKLINDCCLARHMSSRLSLLALSVTSRWSSFLNVLWIPQLCSHLVASTLKLPKSSRMCFSSPAIHWCCLVELRPWIFKNALCFMLVITDNNSEMCTLKKKTCHVKINLKLIRENQIFSLYNINSWCCEEVNNACLHVRRRQWHPTAVLLPGKSHGRRSLVGCSPWGC